MKKTLIIVSALVLLASCEKMEKLNPFNKEKKEKPCPEVSSAAVPSPITKTFESKYPGAVVKKWLNKDGKSFCAVFSINSTKKTAFFNPDGTFQKEENDNNDQNGDHQDADNGCNCSSEDGD